MKGVEFSNTIMRLFWFKEALFLKIIKESEGATVIESNKLRVISSIEVTNSMFASRGVYSTRPFNGVLVTYGHADGIYKKNEEKHISRLTYVSNAHALRRLALARTKVLAMARVLSRAEGA